MKLFRIASDPFRPAPFPGRPSHKIPLNFPKPPRCLPLPLFPVIKDSRLLPARPPPLPSADPGHEGSATSAARPPAYSKRCHDPPRLLPAPLHLNHQATITSDVVPSFTCCSKRHSPTVRYCYRHIRLGSPLAAAPSGIQPSGLAARFDTTATCDTVLVQTHYDICRICSTPTIHPQSSKCN